MIFWYENNCVAHRSFYNVQTLCGAHQTSYQMGTGGDFPRVKRPEREAEHSPPSSTKAKNGVALPPLPHTSSWPSA
jgi:hypothetical protein